MFDWNDAKLLLVDDEAAILKLLETVLRKEGFTSVDLARDGDEALQACRVKQYDLVLLDVMMPGRSGLELCPLIRQTTDAPILFLTARGTDLDKLSGFAVGGDDYITKPFNPLEVVARIRAQLRRHRKVQQGVEVRKEVRSAVFDYGRFRLYEDSGTLEVNGMACHCPALVFQLLLFLCKHPNRIFSKGELYEQVWGGSMLLHDDNTVMVHIRRIRERIEQDPNNPEYLVNVRGLGYKLIHPGKESSHDD